QVGAEALAGLAGQEGGQVVDGDDVQRRAVLIGTAVVQATDRLLPGGDLGVDRQHVGGAGDVAGHVGEDPQATLVVEVRPLHERRRRGGGEHAVHEQVVTEQGLLVQVL